MTLIYLFIAFSIQMNGTNKTRIRVVAFGLYHSLASLFKDKLASVTISE